MDHCLSCSIQTYSKFKGKSLCDNCLQYISKLKIRPFKRIPKQNPSNMCCELCFGPPLCISISESNYTIVCESCSVYCNKIISLKWLDLIQQSGDIKEYELRTEILSELDLKCKEISESFDSFIMNLTTTYKACKKEIKNNTRENLNHIDRYEKDLLEKFSEVVVSRESNDLKTKVFIKNLEVLQDQIVDLNLLSVDELQQTILENLSISFNDFDDFSYLI